MTATADVPVARLTSPHDIVAAVPHLVGFHPSESIVVISLRGPRRRIGLTARTDLPAEADTEALTAELAPRLAHDGANGAVLVCYTEAAGESPGLPRSEFVEALTRHLGAEEIEVHESLLVRAGRWWSYTCTGPCCPADGVPIDPAATSPGLDLLAAEHALAGRQVLPDRAELVASIKPVTFLARAALEQAYERVAPEIVEQIAARGEEAVAAQTVISFADVLEREPSGTLTDDEAARLVLGVGDVLARDEVATWGVDEERAERLLAVLVELCRHALPPWDAPICTLLGWVAYQHGDGGLTNVALDRALASDPDYSMANLLLEMIERQIHPEEVRRVTAGVRGERGRRRRSPGRRRKLRP